LFVIIVIYAFSQGSVEMHLQCDEIYNNHTVVNRPQSVLVKLLWKFVNNWQRYGQ